MRCNVPLGNFIWFIGPMVLLTLILLTSLNLAAVHYHVFNLRLLKFDVAVFGCIALAIAINYIPKTFWSTIFNALYTVCHIIFSGQWIHRLLQTLCCKNNANQEGRLAATQQELQPLSLQVQRYGSDITEPIVLPIHQHPADINFHKYYPQLQVQVNDRSTAVMAQPNQNFTTFRI